ncbi:MAG: cysteine synthase A [Abditibacteriales bacterium]|nr:cysteine synthase A [Abditibacteriales bacterium]
MPLWIVRHSAQDILSLIGNTPMVRLRRLVGENDATVYAKLESFNPGGSVKDRIALSMIEDAERRGLLRAGATIVEPTTGNTGIGLAMVSAVRGYKCIITMPKDMSPERELILRTLGAEVVLTPPEEGMAGAVWQAEEILKKTPNAFMPQQFENPANPEAHRRTTAQEIWRDTRGKVDAFVAGIGTGGTITGVGEVLKGKNPKVKVVGIEPARSAVLSGGQPAMHAIQGIGAGFVPKVLNRDIIDEIYTVRDEDAINTARRVSQREGISCGISAGAAAFVAIDVASRLGKGKTVVVIFPDGGEKYLSLARQM